MLVLKVPVRSYSNIFQTPFSIVFVRVLMYWNVFSCILPVGRCIPVTLLQHVFKEKRNRLLFTLEVYARPRLAEIHLPLIVQTLPKFHPLYRNSLQQKCTQMVFVMFPSTAMPLVYYSAAAGKLGFAQYPGMLSWLARIWLRDSPVLRRLMADGRLKRDTILWCTPTGINQYKPDWLKWWALQ